MVTVILSLLGALRSALRTRADLALENLALRQQLANLRRTSSRARLRHSDRAFWLVLSRFWSRWADVLVVVKPDTVLRWHRAGFACSGDGELLTLGTEIGERSVSRFMPPKPRKPPSQAWRTFLDNHVGSLASIDFFTVPTATFRVLYVFFVLAHDRRRVLHFGVTDHPSAAWTAQQIVEAFPENTTPRFMIRDRDGIFGDQFRRRVQGLGIEELLTAPRSPWQNPFAERLVGSVRRECLDHVVVLGERHLHGILKSYFAYYHRARTHLSLSKDAPDPRQAHPPTMGEIVELPEVGGLHHRYERLAA